MSESATFERKDLHVGLRCLAPVKRSGRHRRELLEVTVTWVSADKFVVEGEFRPKAGRHVLGTFAASSLQILGTKPPALGVVL